MRRAGTAHTGQYEGLPGTLLGYWNDDAQVCDEHIVKRWTAQGDCPGIFVRIETLDGGQEENDQ